MEDRERDDSTHEPAAESRYPIDEPVTDEVRLFFQDLRARESRRTVFSKVRRKETLLRVALVVWIAVGVLFILDLPRLLRYASNTYQHPLLERASAFVEAVINHGQEER